MIIQDRKKSLTLTSLKPGIVPTEAKLISTPNRTPTNTGRGRISPKPITPKNEIGSKLAPKSNSGLSIKYGDKTLDITPKLGSQSPTLSSKKIRQQAQDSTLSQNGKTEKWIQPHTSNRHSRKIIPEIKEEAEDLKGIPRVSSRVRAENPPTFSEAGESSKMPTRIVTPNNLSSFIELLNYNSDSDEDKGFGDTSKISLTKKSKDERDKDTTQDFIREALATMKSDKSAADNKGFSISQSKSLLQKWEKLPVEAVEGHKMSSFAGLPNYKPIKHSTRLVVCAPCSVVFDELFPLVRLNDL